MAKNVPFVGVGVANDSEKKINIIAIVLKSTIRGVHQNLFYHNNVSYCRLSFWVKHEPI